MRVVEEKLTEIREKVSAEEIIEECMRHAYNMAVNDSETQLRLSRRSGLSIHSVIELNELSKKLQIKTTT